MGNIFSNADTEYITFALNSNCRSAGAQFRVVALNPTSSHAAASMTVGIATTDTAEYGVVGVLVEDYLTTTATHGRVCVHGVCRVKNGDDTITAGEFVCVASTSGLVLAMNGNRTNTTSFVVVGQALQNANDTGGTLAIYVNPHWQGPTTI